MRRFGRYGRAVGVAVTVAALAMVALPSAGAQKVLNPGEFTLTPSMGFINIRNLGFDLTPHPNPQCSDGLDNDQDFRTDVPADTECDASPAGDPPEQDDSELVPNFQPKEDVSIRGTINAQGEVTVPPDQIRFPTAWIGLTHPVNGTVGFAKAVVVPTTAIVGVLDPITGFVALRFRFKVHITGNPFNVNLGPTCTIGTDAAPIDLNTLTTSADFGVPYTKNGEATLANSSFSVPSASGCQRNLLVDPNQLINTQMGLPSPAGFNSARLQGKTTPTFGRAVDAVIKTTPAIRTGPAPFTVAFDGSDSIVTKGPATYLWSFPDGVTSTEPIVNHTFTTPGIKSISLRVTDADGDSSVVAVSANVTGTGTTTSTTVPTTTSSTTTTSTTVPTTTSSTTTTSTTVPTTTSSTTTTSTTVPTTTSSTTTTSTTVPTTTSSTTTTSTTLPTTTSSTTTTSTTLPTTTSSPRPPRRRSRPVTPTPCRSR